MKSEWLKKTKNNVEKINEKLLFWLFLEVLIAGGLRHDYGHVETGSREDGFCRPALAQIRSS